MSDIKSNTFVGITAMALRRRLKCTFLKSCSVGPVKDTTRGT